MVRGRAFTRLFVPPAGFEPALPPPEGGALSPELRGLNNPASLSAALTTQTVGAEAYGHSMTRFVYATATTLDGYLADPDHSLDWLFVVDGGEESLGEMDRFIQGVGVMIEGSSTYRWIVEHDDLLEHP